MMSSMHSGRPPPCSIQLPFRIRVPLLDYINTRRLWEALLLLILYQCTHKVKSLAASSSVIDRLISLVEKRYALCDEMWYVTLAGILSEITCVALHLNDMSVYNLLIYQHGHD